MYLYLFYIISWSIALVLVLPVLIVGIIYVFMSNKPQKKDKFTIKTMLETIKSAKSKDDFNKVLSQFKNKYKVFNDEKEFNTWINCIKELAHSNNWDTDSIAKFGQELEDANQEHAKKISVAIATVLKTKENKK